MHVSGFLEYRADGARQLVGFSGFKGNRPESGYIPALPYPNMVRSQTMPPASVPASLLDHLVHTSGLRRSEARRIVEEVVSFYRETPEEFVVRRHRELQAEGMRNRAIYARVAEEMEGWRFRARRLSERQIRRIVYG
jgi:hypothetical protein